MGLFSKDSPEVPMEEATEAPRPGTSGTEMVLMTNRRQASDRLRKAQRAEKAYRAKKRAASARKDYDELRSHFKESFQHLGIGFKMTFGVVKSAPYIMSEKKEKRRTEADQKKKAKAAAKRKKLEEKLARRSSHVDSDEDEEEMEDATS